MNLAEIEQEALALTEGERAALATRLLDTLQSAPAGYKFGK